MLCDVVEKMLRIHVTTDLADKEEEENLVAMLRKVISNEKPVHVSDEEWDHINDLLQQLDVVFVDVCIAECFWLVARALIVAAGTAQLAWWLCNSTAFHNVLNLAAIAANITVSFTVEIKMHGQSKSTAVLLQ